MPNGSSSITNSRKFSSYALEFIGYYFQLIFQVLIQKPWFISFLFWDSIHVCCCCLPCINCSNLTWAVERIRSMVLDCNLRTAGSFLYLKLRRPPYFVRTSHYYLTLAMSSGRFCILWMQWLLLFIVHH